ncbi:hypothetical protein [Pelagibacterium lentulum]|uniref:Uncharacterized protein n=1 Tax=Pelagibacterium lentulum TaxID=2029865 RepID=A0A916RBT5_9HYPH|nr:hypothetical protein [Pelagibacterium lentulum]GGA49585.1 hypothetical protein GCM10011499_19340 [Pelagibacterium lentulum]
MHLSLWTYPWDIADVGFENFLAEAKERTGVNSVSLSASYHAGHFLQPRSPRRKSYFPQDGTIYFQSDDSLWEGKEIVPLVADHVNEEEDMLARLDGQRENSGVAPSAWTVCLHNTRLGMKHPGHVTRSAFGDPNYFSLCPSSPAVRDYAVTLVADMTKRYRPKVVELETPGFMGFDHGYHHEKDGLGLNPEDEFLLSICFCDHCMAAASAAGIDAKAARETVKTLIAAACNRAVPQVQFPDFPTKGIEAFARYPALRAYLIWRTTPVTSLVAEIKANAHPDSEIVAITGVEDWREGMDNAEIAKACDGLLLSLYDQKPSAITAMVSEVRALIGPDKWLIGGLRVFYPEIVSSDDLASRAIVAKAAGCDGLNFYNYGLIPAPRLDWIGAATAAVRN